jgi:hypothetical protein
MDERLHDRLEQLCDEASLAHGNVRFRLRVLGGVSAASWARRSQRQQYWIDVRCIQPVRTSDAGEELFELEAPLLASERPPRPHTPPDFSSDSETFS